MPLDTEKITVAVIEGGHPFDVPNFYGLLRSIEGMDFYPQCLDNWAQDWGHCRSKYDVLLFFNMHMELPAEGPVPEALAALGETEQGLLMLHHALLAFPKSEVWSEIVGIQDRSFSYHGGQDVSVDIAQKDHPITKGLTPWRTVDETYLMAGAAGDSDILLTTTHPKSMQTLAWTRKYRNAPVFCLELGHDARAWSVPQFRKVLARGIRWLAHRL